MFADLRLKIRVSLSKNLVKIDSWKSKKGIKHPFSDCYKVSRQFRKNRKEKV